jgi:hypothetical protein
MVIELAGQVGFEALLALIPLPGRRLPKVTVKGPHGPLRARRRGDRREFAAESGVRFELTW